MNLTEYLAQEAAMPAPCACCEHRERITVHPSTDLALLDLPRASWLEPHNVVTSDLVTPGWAVIVAEVRHAGPGPGSHPGAELWHVHGKALASRVELPTVVPADLIAEIEDAMGGGA